MNRTTNKNVFTEEIKQLMLILNINVVAERLSGLCDFKGIVHPKMKILSSFTHPQVVPNLYEFLCSAEHKGRYFEESL